MTNSNCTRFVMGNMFLGILSGILMIGPIAKGQSTQPCTDPDPSRENGEWKVEILTNDGAVPNAGSPSTNFSLTYNGNISGHWHGSHTSSHTQSSAAADAYGDGTNDQNIVFIGETEFPGNTERGFNSFEYKYKVKWTGTGPPKPRDLSLNSTGQGHLSVKVSCSAKRSTGAQADASGQASCSSLGNAQGDISLPSLTARCEYKGETNTFMVGGDIGSNNTTDTPAMSGNVSGNVAWGQTGSGFGQGSGSWAMKPGTFTNTCYNGGYNVIQMGSVEARGVLNFVLGSNATFEAHADASASITGAGQ